jgi:cytochrome b561
MVMQPQRLQDLPSARMVIGPGQAESSERYDATSIVLHWLVAALVAALWIGGETIEWLSEGPLRADARSMHILLGMLLGIAVGIRFVWRLSFGRFLPPADAGVLAIAAKIAHRGFYVLLGAMVLVGMMLLSVTGDSFFNHLSMTVNDPADRTLADQLQQVHAIIGWIILALVGLHIVAVLFHRYFLHDRLLDRMLPRHRQIPRSNLHLDRG